MGIALLIVAGLAIFVIAAVAVGGVIPRLGTEPTRRVFDWDEAVDFVIEALPNTATAVLSPDDVERILRFHLDHLHAAGLARSAGDLDDQVGVLRNDDAVSAILEAAHRSEFSPEREHVHDVVVAHLAYFEAIGAAEAVPEPEDPDQSS